MVIKHRSEIGDLLNSLWLCGDGVEVGVLFGENAEEILKHWKCKRLFLVDPYIKWPDEIYCDQTNIVNYEEARKTAADRLKHFPNKFFVAETSEQASRMFEDASLDYVYLDANHRFEFIAADIDLWWPKVSPGGIMGGHDYLDIDTDYWKCGVKSAVNQWCDRMRLTPVLCECTSWFVRKI